MTLISRIMIYSSFDVTAFSNGLLLGVSSYSLGGGVIDFWKNIYLCHGEPIDNFASLIEKGSIWVKGHPGAKAHWEMRHPR